MNSGVIPTSLRSEHLDHVAVWSASWKDSAKFLNDFLSWDIHPLQFSASGESVGDMGLVFINANGVWIELVQPTSKGPGMDLLETLGDGAVVDDSIMQIYQSKGSGHIMEIGIEVHNLNDFLENIESPIEKIKIVDYARTNQDIKSPFKKDDVMQENYFYFPLDLSNGMNIKVFEKNVK